MDEGMHGKPKLLLWDYSDEEKQLIDQFLEEVKAPPAFSIRKDQGYLTLREILHTNKEGEKEFECDEKVILFYNIPSKGISFLIDQYKQRKFPQTIYAAVTEHSINWPFNELMEDLIEEKKAFEKAQKASAPE